MKLVNIWSLLRSEFRNSFSFAEIKDIAGKCGLPTHKLAHIQQSSRGGASKGQLMDELDKLYQELDLKNKDMVVKNLIKELATKNEKLKDKIEELLDRFGWGLSNYEPYPLELKIDIETVELPEKVQIGINKCLRRFRDGDLTGAMSSICGTLDSLTEEIFIESNIRNHKNKTYQERISLSVVNFEEKFKRSLEIIGMNSEEIKRLWNNHKKSVSQAAYVLGSCRRRFSDVHGKQLDPNNDLLEIAINCAVYILRCLSVLKKIVATIV